MTTTLVSVLIPAYKHESYVRFAVESALRQTHANLELIVIDDASPDGTWDILQSIRDERLRCHRHDVNRGACATLNEALGMARGEYVAILNSDDVYHPRRIEILLAEARKSSMVEGLIFSDVEFIDGAGRQASEHPRAQRYAALCNDCRSLAPANWFFAGNPAISTSNFFFARSLAERTGPFSPLRYGHDWDWALRTRATGAPVWVRENLLGYRVHDANTLSEDDRWRHVHENSFIQARGLLLPDAAGDAIADPETRARQIIAALLANESLHPLSLLCFLIFNLAGVDAERLNELVAGKDGRWVLPEITESRNLPVDLLGSLDHLVAQSHLVDQRLQIIRQMSGEVADRDETIAAQASLIEERWQVIEQMTGEVANRDTCIAAQVALIEERWQAIQQMSKEIADRDKCITEQAAVIAEQAEVIATRDRTIGEFYANPFIRAVLFVKHRLAGNR